MHIQDWLISPMITKSHVYGYNPASFHADINVGEEFLSRVINPESAGKNRTRLTKAIVISIRELAKQTEPTPAAQDLASFISLALSTIAEGIDASVVAWEKRGYWVKADKFRMEWMWTGTIAEKMKAAVLGDDWETVAMLLPQIASKLSKVQVSEHHRLGTPWEGAYHKLRE